MNTEPDNTETNSETEQQARARHHHSLMERLRNLPPSVGVVLMGIGTAGLVIPGPWGTPFILAGGLVLAPRVFRGLDKCVQNRFPDFYWTSMQAVERYLQDLEKRYPSQNAAPAAQDAAPPTPAVISSEATGAAPDHGNSSTVTSS